MEYSTDFLHFLIQISFCLNKDFYILAIFVFVLIVGEKNGLVRKISFLEMAIGQKLSSLKEI